MPVKLEGDWGRLERVLRDVADADMTQIHRSISDRVLTNTTMRFRQGVDPEGAPWERPRWKWRPGPTMIGTKTLLNSIHAKSAPTFAAVGTNTEYARIHQFGGVIKPKTAKCLAIPWSDDARKYGYARVFPMRLRLVWPRGSDHGWLTEDQGSRNRKTVLHYLLRRQVTIPERPFLGLTPADMVDIGEVIRGFLIRAAR